MKAFPLGHCSRGLGNTWCMNHAVLLREISMCPYSIIWLEKFVLECSAGGVKEKHYWTMLPADYKCEG